MYGFTPHDIENMTIKQLEYYLLGPEEGTVTFKDMKDLDKWLQKRPLNS